MNKGKKENIETEPVLADEDFDADDLGLEELEVVVDDEKTKGASKQAFESRRRLEEILEEKKRRKDEDYFNDLD